ncbi:MAG: flavodoxin family protein [Candidatus Omnitrophota bacterium]
MRITAFNSSPRASGGNTYIMVEEFLGGAKEAGADVKHVLLAEKNIKHCLGCFACWLKTQGKCVIKDDMEVLLNEFIDSDIVVFATPLYVDNVTAIMKGFMDRIIPIVEPRIEEDEQGESRHPLRFGKSPKIVVISNCGFPGQKNFQVLKLLFKRIARNMSSEVMAQIYRDEGELLRRHPLILKPLIWNYKRLLRKAGKEIVVNSKVSDETISQLGKPLIAEKDYIKGANQAFEKLLSETKT